MNNTFKYTLPFNSFLWKLLAFFVITTVIGLIVPFEFQYRRSLISNQMFAFGGAILSLIVLIVALVLFTKSQNSKKNSNHINFGETSVTFPVGASEKVEIDYNSIESITEVGNKFNGEIVQIKSKNGAFKQLFIQGKGFESMELYKEFLSKLMKIK